jgi:hypothetical protein
MDGIVTVEAFGLETGVHLDHDGFPERNLVLDDDVDDCVERFVRHLDALLAMILRHEPDALLFIEFEPLLGDWIAVGVIACHLGYSSSAWPTPLGTAGGRHRNAMKTLQIGATGKTASPGPRGGEAFRGSPTPTRDQADLSPATANR